MTYKDKEKQKEYLRQHYLDNKKKYHVSSYSSRKKVSVDIDLIKESKPCKDCGKWYPYIM